jgi:ABC-type branched-subunit amino acid transport system substrate-binding protein
MSTGKHTVGRGARRSFLAALAGAVAMSLGAGAHAQTAPQGITDGEIVIGALGPLTGPLGFIGGPGRDGLQLGFDRINEAGGINGRKVRLVFEHAGTPAESVAAAKKLVENDKVFALILASGSTGAAAAADYVRASGVPTYNIYGGTSIIRTPYARNVFHGAISNVDISGQGMIDQAFKAAPNARKIGILAGTYAFPQSHLKAIQAKLAGRPGTEVVVEQFDAGARDFTAQLLAFARQRVDVVIALGSFSEVGYAVKQAPEKGLKAPFVLDGSGVNDGIIPIIGAENTKNVWGYFNAPFFPNQVDEPAIQAFNKLWVAKYGQPPVGRPNLYDQVGYGSAFIIAQALRGAGKSPTWASLMDSWEKLKDAKPSDTGGLDVIFAESFAPNDHEGNKRVAPARIVGDKWKVVW